MYWTEYGKHRGEGALIVFIHGMNCSGETFSPLINKIRSELPPGDVLVGNLPLRWNSRCDLQKLTESMADGLQERLQGYETLILVGHSAGGVLVQSAYLALRSRDAVSRHRVRLVLIAPISRGWAISHHLPIKEKVIWFLGSLFAKCLGMLDRLWTGKTATPLWVLQLQRGAPFIVGLRLKWLRCADKLPEVHVLVGSVDEIISWRDMVDEVLPKGSVCYREVQYSDHIRIIDVENPHQGANRAGAIVSAIRGERQEADFEPWDHEPPAQEPAVERVVFVMHGIRDEGHWTQKIAARARRHFRPKEDGANQQTEPRPKEVAADGEAHPDREDKPRKIAVETSSYGYFSMLEFLLPAARTKKIHWLMDEYVEARRRFPNAEFSYISHSNGTYLLAQALLDYPEVSFDRIAFAGSVVSTDYPWTELKNQKRVGEVLNFSATADWVVSFFPRLAQIFPPLKLLVGQNLGGAGVVPFQDPVARTNKHVVGGHGAAIQEWNWDNLAKFAVATPVPIPAEAEPHYSREPLWWCGGKRGHIVTPGVMLLLLLALGGLSYLAWWNPMLFWAPAFVWVTLGAATVSILATMADQKSFAARDANAKACGIVLLSVAIAVGLWWMVSWFVPGIRDAWSSFDLLPYPELVGVLRTLSVGAFFLLIWKILTKV